MYLKKKRFLIDNFIQLHSILLYEWQIFYELLLHVFSLLDRIKYESRYMYYSSKANRLLCQVYTVKTSRGEPNTPNSYSLWWFTIVQIKKCIYAYKSSSNTKVLIYCLQFHGFIKCFFLHFKMCFLSCLQDEIKTMECYV